MTKPADRVVNPFVHRTAAERYAAARPYFHPLVVERIAAATGCDRFGRVLDVACGTGQSSRAIAEVADRVDAIDASESMLAAAAPHERVHFQVAPAERLPFDDGTFDFVTVGLGFHWLDRAAFLAEAKRVLREDGWLAVYNSAFTGRMLENDAFLDWVQGTYLGRFPSPPRHPGRDRNSLVEEAGLMLAGEQEFEHDETLAADDLVAYFLTQSNVIAAVEEGEVTIDEVSGWIAAEVEPYFDGRRTLRFAGSLWLARRPVNQNSAT